MILIIDFIDYLVYKIYVLIEDHPDILVLVPALAAELMRACCDVSELAMMKASINIESLPNSLWA